MRGAIVAIAVVALAGCDDNLESPTPSLDGASPQLVCNQQLTTGVTVSGENLTPLPADVLTDETHLILPSLEVQRSANPDGSAGSGEPVSVDGSVQWVDAQTMTFEVAADLALEPGVYDVGLENPDGQAAALSAALQVVPPPVVQSIDDEVICVDEGPHDLEISGQGFIVLEGPEYPTVTLGGVELAVQSASDCFDLGGPVTGQSCETLVATVAQDALDAGVHDLQVTNPETAPCASQETIQVQVVDPPVLETIVTTGFDATAPESDLVCDDQGAEALTLTGQGFLELDGALPTVTIGGYSAEADSIGGTCTSLVVGTGQQCTELTFAVPEGSLAEGVLDVVVTNPEPASCSTAEDVDLVNLPPPAVAALQPPAVCADIDTVQDWTVVGDGFLFGGSDLAAAAIAPTVAIGSQTYEPAPVSDTCTLLPGRDDAWTCTDMVVQVDTADYDTAGLEAVLVTNPAPPDCDSADSEVSLEVVPPPSILDVDQRICGGGDTAVITAVDVPEDPTGLDVTLIHDGDGTEYPVTVDAVTEAADSEVDRARDITISVPQDVPSGFYQVEVDSGGCVDVWGDDDGEFLVEITSIPLVFFVDPPVLYQPTSPDDSDPDIVIEATAYVTGINTALDDPTLGVTDVELTNPDGTTTSVPASDWNWDDTDPTRLFVTLGPDLAPTGDWDILVTDAAQCEAELSGAFTVTDTATVELTDLTPPYGWVDAFTSVEVAADDEVGAGGFQDVPRVYLNPVDTTGDALAAELSAITFQDASLLDAVVPAGLAVGEYDLIVVNPDGTVGYLTDDSSADLGAFRVTADSPPVVDDVAPGSTTNQADDVVFELSGAHFRPGMTATLDCTDPDPTGTDTALIELEQLDGSGDCTETGGLTLGPLAGGEATSARGCADVATAPAPLICLVRVTNTDNDTQEVFSAVSITNPAANLTSWVDSPDVLNEPRAAPVGAAGRATRTARYVYAIGGDDAAGTLSRTIEWARIGPRGNPDEWFLPYDPAQGSPYAPGTDVYLPNPRTMAASVRIGRFVYLVGGEVSGTGDADGPTDTLLRAQILDPLQTPRITGITVDVGDGVDGLAGGTYVYRVSALFAAGADHNPGGESLPGDPFVVRLPDFADLLTVEIDWAPPAACPGGDDDPAWCDDIVGYRIYRTPLTGGGSGDEQWVDDQMTGTSWTDLGDEVQGGLPLPVGALGHWYEFAGEDGMAHARLAPCVAAARDPGAPDDTAYLYVAGGADDTTVYGDLEALPITLSAEHDQDAGAWFVPDKPDATPAALGIDRWQCSGLAASSDLHSRVDEGDAWVYFGPGLEADDQAGREVSVGLVGSGGDFVDKSVDVPGWQDFTQSDQPPAHAGYAAFSASNSLYLAGGSGGSASSGVRGGKLCGGTNTSACTAPEPPYVSNWNAETGLPAARYLPGAAQESSVLFVIGGQDSSGDATDTVFWNNY